MRFIAPVFIVGIFLFCSCTKEEPDGFTEDLKYAYDFRVNPVNGDTFYRFYLPNGFSPNGDGRNDLFYPIGVGVQQENYEMKIYSRENNLIYYTDDLYKAWDGRVQGHSNLCAGDIFTVEINARDSANENHHYLYHAVQWK